MVDFLTDPEKVETLALSAVIAWGVIEVVKPALKLYNVDPNSPKHALIIRAGSLLVGAILGAAIYAALDKTAGVTRDDITTGAALGAAAGALNAALVAAIKRKLKGASK